MSRGGLRSTSWKAAWKHGATKTIRVPVALADRLLEIAKTLDEGQAPAADSHVTGNTEVKSLLEADDVAIAIDALATAIEMKRAAIKTELKKRGKANNPQIARWRSEIEALERAISTRLELS